MQIKAKRIKSKIPVKSLISRQPDKIELNLNNGRFFLNIYFLWPLIFIVTQKSKKT